MTIVASLEMNRKPIYPEIGTVIRYQDHDLEWHCGVVTCCPKQYLGRGHLSRKLWACWLYENGQWKEPQHVSRWRVEVHPDPDPVIAAYTAWMLTQ